MKRSHKVSNFSPPRLKECLGATNENVNFDTRFKRVNKTLLVLSVKYICTYRYILLLAMHVTRARGVKFVKPWTMVYFRHIIILLQFLYPRKLISCRPKGSGLTGSTFSK